MSLAAAPRVMAKAKGKKKVKAKKAKVKVVLRVRPQLGEVELAEEPCVEVSTETIQSQMYFSSCIFFFQLNIIVWVGCPCFIEC